MISIGYEISKNIKEGQTESYHFYLFITDFLKESYFSSNFWSVYIRDIIELYLRSVLVLL